MSEFRRRVPVPRRAVVVGVNGPFDLGVNPISHLCVHLDGVVAAVTAVGEEIPYTDMTNLTVMFQGSSVVNMNGVDLRAVNAAISGQVPYVLNHPSVTNGDLVRVSIPVHFGRKRHWVKECFPATKKGDFQIQMTFGAEGATFQTRNVTIEAVELPGAVPERFLKTVSIARALTATDFDFPLPVGNTYAGLVIFQPTVADAGAATGSIRNLTMLMDHREEFVIGSRFENMRSEFEMMVKHLDVFEDAALPQMAAYGLVNFSPDHMDDFLVDSDAFEDVRLRFELDNAGSPRIIPLELVKVPAAAA